jgi:hypothetical protein
MNSVQNRMPPPKRHIVATPVAAAGQVVASWGLHLVDVNLAVGNLVDIVGQQADAWVAARRQK